LSLISRVRTASALPPGERALALRAVAGLALVRLVLPLVGFTRIARALDGTTVRRHRRPGRPPSAADVRRAMQRAARTVPGTRCLAEAIVAMRLLRRAGLPAEMEIGVARGSDAARPLDAHAWVRSGDFTVTGDAEFERYARLIQVSGGA